MHTIHMTAHDDGTIRVSAHDGGTRVSATASLDAIGGLLPNAVVRDTVAVCRAFVAAHDDHTTVRDRLRIVTGR